MTRFSPVLAAGLTLAIGACVPRAAPPPPVAAPAPPAPPPVAAPAPVADWQDWSWTPGAWRYVRDPGGSRAIFAAAGQQPLVELRCERGQRAMLLSRSGSAPGAFTIRTSATTRTVATRHVPGIVPQVVARLPADDRLLDAMVFTRGRFTIEQPGTPPLVLAPWAEVGRVVEDCRA